MAIFCWPLAPDGYSAGTCLNGPIEVEIVGRGVMLLVEHGANFLYLIERCSNAQIQPDAQAGLLREQ